MDPPPSTLAVDSQGRILAGLDGKSPTITIHDHDDIDKKSKFATKGEPRSLAITSKGDIVVASHVIMLTTKNIVEVMDYHGNNIRIAKPPQEASRWVPTNICCSQQGEIFVLNWGDKSVYRYTADGDRCLGRIISGLDDPRGIDITEDGRKLYIVEYQKAVVKIFHRS